MNTKSWFAATVAALNALAVFGALLMAVMLLVENKGRSGGLALLVALAFVAQLVAFECIARESKQ